MARQILVLEPHAVRHSSHVKKCVAQLLIRRLLAVWEVENVSIRRLNTKLSSATPKPQIPIPAKSYIPEKMPPREVPGVFFREPQSDQWKRDHRSVILS